MASPPQESGPTRRTVLGGLAGTAVSLRAAGAHAAREPIGLDRGRADARSLGEAVPGLHRVPVHLHVDGEEHRLETHPDESLLALLRDRLDVTAVKKGCGHGACGACSVRLDGEVVVSCLLPATAADGRRVETVRSVGGAELHPVQRAMLAEDGLQCGYCTPGWVVGASTLCDRKRAAGEKLSPADVAKELDGHLCRCAAYEGLGRAVSDACAGRYDDRGPRTPRLGAEEKIRGEARYTVDTRFEGQLVGRILRAPHARARVIRVDPSRALELPGVLAVVDLTEWTRSIRHPGQELLAVAAVDEQTARAALALVELELEPLPPIVDIDGALRKGADVVHDPALREAPNSAEISVFPAFTRGNLRGPLVAAANLPGRARRLVEAAERGEDGRTAVGGTFEAHSQSHTPLEPHACVAAWDGPDAVTVYLGTQAVSDMAEDIAERWCLSRDKVRVIARHVGGAFGCKATFTMEAVAAIELARVAGRPVSVVLDRREEFDVGGYRPAVRLDLTLGLDRDGDLEAIRATGWTDSGIAVGGLSANLCRFAYPDVPSALEDYDVFTHAAAAAPFRAPGGPQTCWALEQAVDMAAAARDEDPIVVRRRWTKNPGMLRLLDWAEALPAWRDRASVASDRGRFQRGVGLATACWFYLIEPRVRVRVTVGPEGFEVGCAGQDFGQGLRTVLAVAAAERLGLEPRDISVRVGDSDEPIGPHASGSRSTASCVPAVQRAVDRVLPELLRDAERKWDWPRGSAQVAPGGIAGPGEEAHPWSELLRDRPERTVIVGRPSDEKGMYFPFAITEVNSGKFMTAAVQLAEVELDRRLGRLRVLESWTGLSVGRRFVPRLALSQVHGGVIQGIGYTLFEERRRGPRTGLTLTGGLEDYRIPTLADVPELHVHFDDGEAPANLARGGGVGLAELPVVAVAPAIGNALHRASGLRSTRLPLNPARLIDLMARGPA